MICPRRGCNISDAGPSLAYDADTKEAMKQCPRCRMCFWQRTDCIVVIAPISMPSIMGACTGLGDVCRIWMSPVDYPDIRKFNRDHVEFESDLAFLRKGRQATFTAGGRRIELWVRRGIPENTVYAVRASDGDADLASPTWLPTARQAIIMIQR